MKYLVDPDVDYREPEHRLHGFLAYSEAMYDTEELHQQLRLMNWAIDQDQGGDIEAKLWLAFLWGACYNAITPWVMLQRYKAVPMDEDEFTRWYNATFELHRFDTDCRYRKAKMLACVASYRKWLGGKTQAERFGNLFRLKGNRAQALQTVGAESIFTFGRLAIWNWIEALEVVTDGEHGLDVSNFQLADIAGSESNRNGVAYAISRDELVTHHGKKHDGRAIRSREAGFLEKQAADIFDRLKGDVGQSRHVTRLNAETCFCWYKKMLSRPTNSRYLGWDGDRTYDELLYLQQKWPEYSVEPLWRARRAYLPPYLRHEELPQGMPRGPHKGKMRIFYETGKMPDVYHHQRGEGYICRAR